MGGSRGGREEGGGERGEKGSKSPQKKNVRVRYPDSADFFLRGSYDFRRKRKREKKKRAFVQYIDWKVEKGVYVLCVWMVAFMYVSSLT